VKCKPVIPRARAVQDVEDALDYYLSEASKGVALGFISELERAYCHLSRFPETGTNRYAQELGLQGLRAWPLVAYPYIVFYTFPSDYVDIWRVLHAKRDVPAWLRL